MKILKRIFSRHSLKQILCHGVRLGALAWLVCHFTLTMGYVMPLNPIKMEYNPLFEQTIGTYFPQNWSLFAPDPVSGDHALLARCLDMEESRSALAGNFPTDNWQDISTPAWEYFQRNRFSAYDRLIRPQTNAMREFLGGAGSLKVFSDSCRKGTEESCRIYEARLALFRLAGGVILQKVGSAYCQEALPGKATGVALRMRETPAAPWSERYTPQPKINDYDVGVYPVVRDIPTTGLYQQGGAK